MVTKVCDMIQPNDPLMLEAIDAMRRYHEALSSGGSDVELERLRVQGESLFEAIAAFNLRALGHPSALTH